MFERIGYSALVLWSCLTLYAGIVRGRERLDLPRFSHEAHQLGIGMLPTVTLIAAVVGLLIGQQADHLLQQVNVPQLALRVVASAVVLEFAPLLIGILVAARGGVALAVRIASMVSRQEMEGLILSGVNPVHYTIGASLLATTVVSFALSVWTIAVMLGCAGLWLDLSGAVPAPLFIESLSLQLRPGDLLQGVTKPLVFGVLITLIAAREGGNVLRRPDGISLAATRTMLQAIAAILIADLLFAVALA